MAYDGKMTKPPADQTPGVENTRSGACYRPSVDILERSDELVVLADVPGASPGQIDLHFEDGTLTIHAKVQPRNQDVAFLVREYGVGDYWRTFQVAETVDAGKITADYADGVLALHLPKPEAAKPRKIPITT
jgi:HSP20 family protein